MSLTISKLIRHLEHRLVNYGDMPLTIGVAEKGDGEISDEICFVDHEYYMVMSVDEKSNKKLFIAGWK